MAVVAGSLLLVLVACGDDDDAATPATTVTTATTATTDDPVEPDPSGRSELADGRHFGFWASFEIGDVSAVGQFDLARFLTGADAEAAAAERGDEVDDDYYVVNDNPRLRTLVAEGDTEVLVLTGGGADLSPTNVADFAVDRHPQSGFWVTIEEGIVTAIEEQYVP